MTRGEKLRAARHAAGLTITQVAAAVGVTERTVMRWEHNETTPSAERLTVLADLLHIDLGDINGVV